MENSFPFQNFLIQTLLTILFASIFTHNNNTIVSASSTNNAAFIKAACTETLYPTLCFTSLSNHSNAIGNDPKLLAHTALSIAFDAAKATSSEIVHLSKGAGVKTRDAVAMSNCVELLTDSLEQLGRSVSEMKKMILKKRKKKEKRGGLSTKFEMVMSDVETWVSAALTNDETCLDGFREKDIHDKLATVVSDEISKVAQLTSVALALIHGYASAHC